MVQWWAYVIIFVAVASFCAISRYVLKKLNDTEFTERFERIRETFSASTQVSLQTEKDIVKNKSSSKKLLEDKRSKSCSLIFSKEKTGAKTDLREVMVDEIWTPSKTLTDANISNTECKSAPISTNPSTVFSSQTNVVVLKTEMTKNNKNEVENIPNCIQEDVTKNTSGLIEQNNESKVDNISTPIQENITINNNGLIEQNSTNEYKQSFIDLIKTRNDIFSTQSRETAAVSEQFFKDSNSIDANNITTGSFEHSDTSRHLLTRPNLHMYDIINNSKENVEISTQNLREGSFCVQPSPGQLCLVKNSDVFEIQNDKSQNNESDLLNITPKVNFAEDTEKSTVVIKSLTDTQGHLFSLAEKDELDQNKTTADQVVEKNISKQHAGYPKFITVSRNQDIENTKKKESVTINEKISTCPATKLADTNVNHKALETTGIIKHNTSKVNFVSETDEALSMSGDLLANNITSNKEESKEDNVHRETSQPSNKPKKSPFK